MRVPKRKNERYDRVLSDTFMTQTKLDQMKDQLDRLKTIKMPAAAKEVKRLAEMGDLSENAGYSIAKAKLRGMQQHILDLEQQIKTATVIAPTQSEQVEVGNRVTIEINGKQHTYHLLGSSETHPEAGIISHVSPLGKALIGKKVGETINVKLNADKTLNVTVINIK